MKRETLLIPTNSDPDPKNTILQDSHSSRDQALLLTETQLAERWQASTKLIQKQRADGTGVPFVKIGRLVRYRLEEVVAYEEACRRTNTCEGSTS